jgi:hypothetical protein
MSEQKNDSAPKLSKLNTERIIETVNDMTSDHKVVTYLSGTVTEAEREYPEPQRHSGTLDAPFEFWRKRKIRHQAHHDETSHLLIDKSKGMITLVCDERDLKSVPAAVIVGKLEFNPDLLNVKLNTGQMFDPKSLVQHLRKYRALFTDRSRCNAIAESLLNFSYQSEIEVQKLDDQRGNSLHRLETRLKKEINLDFQLTCPIFKGTEAKTFGVMCGVQISGTSCTFWLESIDLYEMEIDARDKLIDEQVAKFDDAIVVIEQTS